jgi:carbon-monoxide dehydrogenase iron sulfur subunit
MNMHKFIIADSKKCTGCGVCELACTASKEKTFNRRMSRIRVVSLEPLIDTALTCLLCEEPSCVTSCPRDALRQDEKTGIIVVDEHKCTGCGWCIQACEFGALVLPPGKKTVTVCDLCGGDPLCVKFCTPRALELTSSDKLCGKNRRSALKDLFQYGNKNRAS